MRSTYLSIINNIYCQLETPQNIKERYVCVADENIRYDTEKAKRLEEWKSISPEIMSAYVQMQTPNKRQCADCCLSTDELYRCCDCCSWETTCLTCLRLRHKHPHLHLEGTMLTNTRESIYHIIEFEHKSSKTVYFFFLKWYDFMYLKNL